MANFENGMAPITQSANTDNASVPKSAFNMSRVHHVSGIIGALMPVDVLETIPNEDYTINYAAMIESRNPLLKPMKSGMKVTFHTYYMSCRDMWKGWDMFIDKGRNGTHTASVPKYYPAYKESTINGLEKDVANDYTTLTPCSPADYMGIPIAAYDYTRANQNYCYLPTKVTQTSGGTKGTEVSKGYYGNNANNNEKWGLNALPFHMYNSICKHYYYNKNLLGNNTNIYPEDEDNEKIPFYAGDSGYINTHTPMSKPTGLSATVHQNGESGIYVPQNNTDVYETYNALHFRQFRGDYFNTANPFPDLIRGNRDDLNIPLNATIDFSNVFNGTGSDYSKIDLGIGRSEGAELPNILSSIEQVGSKWADNPTANAILKNSFNKTILNISGVSLNALRKVAVLEKFMQRNATTDGSYREFINAQFGYMPKIHECKPTYIGGSVMDINFGSVAQTGASTNDSMLGQKSGTAFGEGLNSIGKFHCEDYGYIMTIACIVPDMYYDNQGLDTMWTRTEQDKVYYPLLNNLEPQPILNKELFVSGDKNYDEDVWGYANRFEDMKSRRNIIGGLASCGDLAIADSQGWLKRTFNVNNKPALNMQFLTMSPANIDLVACGFSSNNEIPFNLTIGCMIDKVSPMPVNPLPADLGIKY